MNVHSDDVQNIWVEGTSHLGDNTFTELFTHKKLSHLGGLQNFLLEKGDKPDITFTLHFRIFSL